MYDFNGKKKTLQKKTFYREELAKEKAGITNDLNNTLIGLKMRYDRLNEQYEKATDQDAIFDQLVKLNEEIVAVGQKMEWFRSFETSKNVLSVILVEGSDDLTVDDLSGDDAKAVWEDFFTQKSPIRSESKDSTKKSA
jgi:hypothetical protein